MRLVIQRVPSRDPLTVAIAAAVMWAFPAVAQSLPALPAAPSGAAGGASAYGGFGSLPAGQAASGPRKGFQFSPRGTVTLNYTDNVLLTTTNRKADVLVTPTAGFTMTEKTQRTTISADGDVSYDFYQATTRLNALRGNARAQLNSDVIDQFLTFQARAATDQQRVNQFNSAPVSDRAFGGNQSQVLNYGATPTVRFRAGDFMKVDTSYDVSAVTYLKYPQSGGLAVPSNTIQQAVRANLTSGSLFETLTWTATGLVQRSDRPGPNSASQTRSAEGSLYYAIVPNFKIVGTGGYDDVKQPTLTNTGPLGGVHATGGFRWSLSRRTQVSFDAGRRYDRPYYTANVTYGLGRAIALHASYNITIETPQSLVSQNLSQVIRGPTGELLDPITGLPANPNADPFSLNNQAFRRKSATFGVDGTLGRNSYAINGTYDRREGLTLSHSLAGSVLLSRQFSTLLRGSVTVSYNKTTGDTTTAGLARNSETVQARAQLDYTLGRFTNLSAAYFFQRQHAFPTRTRENGAKLSLTRKF